MLHLNLNFILVGIQGKWSRKASGTHSEGKNVNYFSRLVSVLSTIFQESLKNSQKFRSYRSILRFSVRVRVVLPSSFVVSNELRSKKTQSKLIIRVYWWLPRSVQRFPSLSPPLPLIPSGVIFGGWYKPSNNTFLPVLWESTLYTNISMHILLTVLPTFPIELQGEFVYQSRASWVGDHFPYYHNLNVWSGGDTIGEIKCVSLLRVIFYPGPFHP